MPSTAERSGGPGMARERTALAWQRMAMGFTSLAALTVGAAAHRNAPRMLAVAGVLFVFAAVVWLYARRRAAGDALTAARPLRLLSAAAATAGVLAGVLVLLAR